MIDKSFSINLEFSKRIQYDDSLKDTNILYFYKSIELNENNYLTIKKELEKEFIRLIKKYK